MTQKISLRLKNQAWKHTRSQYIVSTQSLLGVWVRDSIPLRLRCLFLPWLEQKASAELISDFAAVTLRDFQAVYNNAVVQRKCTIILAGAGECDSFDSFYVYQRARRATWQLSRGKTRGWGFFLSLYGVPGANRNGRDSSRPLETNWEM